MFTQVQENLYQSCGGVANASRRHSEHPLKYTRVPVDTYINALKEQGVPEVLQWLLHERLYSLIIVKPRTVFMPPFSGSSIVSVWKQHVYNRLYYQFIRNRLISFQAH